MLSTDATLNIKDTTDNGIVILNPTAGDASTCTINRFNTGTSYIKALQRVGYVTLNQADQLKFGNANLDIGNAGFLAVLVRIPADDLGAGYYKILESTQTYGASIPKLALTVRGMNFATAAEARLPVIDSQAGDLTSTVKNVYSTSTGWAITNGFDNTLAPFGGNSSTSWVYQPRWTWIILARADATPPADTSIVTMGSTSTWIAANRMNVGYAFNTDDLQELSSGSLNVRNAGLALLNSGAANGLDVFTGLDFAIGGNSLSTASKNIDVARIIKYSACPTLRQMIGLLKGRSFEEVGITPGSQDKLINLESSAAAGADITTLSGTPYWQTTATDGPLLEIPVGTLTTTLVKTIANGKVTL